MKYQIESRAGVIYGVYEGADKKEAFLAMLAEIGDEVNYGEPHVGTEADWIIAEFSEDARIYAENAETHGEVEFQGQKYALTFQAQLTNRVFDGWFGDAREGEEYTSEWSAPAIGQDGEEYVVRWQFDAVKGQEPEDDGDWPWDEIHEVIPA